MAVELFAPEPPDPPLPVEEPEEAVLVELLVVEDPLSVELLDEEPEPLAEESDLAGLLAAPLDSVPAVRESVR